MSNKICKCGHDESEHEELTGVNHTDLACFHKNNIDNFLEYCTCMAFEEDFEANYKVQAEQLKFMSEQIDKLNAPMPCGHLARYAVNGEDGTQYCCMCLCASVTGTDDPKIQAKIAEIINHE